MEVGERTEGLAGDWKAEFGSKGWQLFMLPRFAPLAIEAPPVMWGDIQLFVEVGSSQQVTIMLSHAHLI